MNAMHIEQYLKSHRLSFESSVTTDFSFQMKMRPGCRFRSCDATLSIHENGRQTRLAIFLPLVVKRDEYSAVSARIASINESLLPGQTMNDVLHYQECFMLDAIDGTVRYEVAARIDSSEKELKSPDEYCAAIEAIANETFSYGAELILRTVSEENTRIIHEAVKEKMREDRAAQRKSFINRLLDFFGLTSEDEDEENYPDDDAPEEDSDIPSEDEDFDDDEITNRVSFYDLIEAGIRKRANDSPEEDKSKEEEPVEEESEGKLYEINEEASPAIPFDLDDLIRFRLWESDDEDSEEENSEDEEDSKEEDSEKEDSKAEDSEKEDSEENENS